MDGVAGIQLDIAYDAASLATPTVTLGGLSAGAMLAANTSRPGIIRIAIISTREFSGNGQIAKISFASKTGSGGITSITTSMIDKNSSPIASTASNSTNEPAASGAITTPGIPFTQPSQQTAPSGTTTTTAPSTVSGTRMSYPGAVTLPTDQQQRVDSQPTPSSTPPVITGEPTEVRSAEQTQATSMPSPTADTKAVETAQYVVYKGIIDRFKLYTGSKTLPAMVALFEKKVAQTIHQEPTILLSDGHRTATLTIDIPGRISSSPNFAVNGGTLITFKQDKQISGRWRVEVLPDTGALRVTVTIIAGAEVSEFPLTVAPPIKTALTLDERGWNRFLKESGTPTAPRHDLNNDGVRDYIDEFIFVANHLAGIKVPASPASISNPSTK